MARFEIKSKDGSSIRYTGKPRYNGSYLKPSFIEFAEVSSPTPIAWEVGDYVDYPRTGMRYRLYSIPQPTKNARKGSHGNAFTYSGVQFHAATKELEIALFKDLVTADNNIHFSTSPDVATFENIEGIARRIQACMDYFFPNRWEIRIAEFDEVNDAEVLGKIRTAKDFALSGGTCLDALSKIYELWQDIGWVHTHENGKEVITIGYPNKRIGANTTDSYVYGKGNGLTAIKRNQTNREEFATRLYVYGSERNIPSRYYNGLDILNAESVDIRNLMLPLDRWGKTDGLPDARKAYIENAEAVAKYGLIPKTHYFDSEEAGADIYPSIEGMTIGRIRKVLGDMGQTQYVPNLDIYPDDSERVDKVLSAENPEDDGIINREGKQYDLTKSIDISSTDFTVSIPSDSAAEIVNEKQIAFAQFIIDENSRGMVSMNPGMNIIVLGEQIASIRAVFELADSHYGPWKNVSQIKEVSAVSINATNWSIAMPQMNIKFTSEKRVFEAYLMMKLYITPASSSARTATVVFPSAPLNINFNRLLPTTFTMELKQLGFDIEERASVGKGKTISMKSGMCEGRNFAISEVRYNEGTDSWVLTCKRQQDDTLGMYFPNIPYEIKAGDEFVLLDIALPESYIRVAQERLLEEGQKLLARASKIQNHYEPSIDAKVMFESGRSLREGMFMEITDEDVVDNTTDYILIDTLNIYEDESAIPTYKVTLRERRKVTYKGTPSATSSNDTKPVEESVQESVSASVDLSDYYTKEEVNELIDEVSAGDVDLTNYYTKGEVDSKFATIDLSPYAKSADVAQTYATIVSLNGVDNRLKGIEGYFATSEDAGTQIDKWNEIVAFLNATEGTTLAGILATYYTKTEIDGKITTINNSIISIDNKYASTKTWADTLASLIVNENGSVRIKANLIVDGDTASGGEGGSSSVGIQGIKLNGTTYRDENSDGIIDLGTIGGGTLTEITFEMIVEALGYTPVSGASLGSLAYKNGLTASDVGALSTSGGTINSNTYDILVLDTSYAYGDARIHLKANGESKSLFGWSSAFGTMIYNATNGYVLGIKDDGTPHYNGSTLYHTGNFNPANYLPLAGGTMKGNLNFNAGLSIKSANTTVLEMYSGVDTYLRGSSNIYLSTPSLYYQDATSTVHTIIHSGNYSNYALPKTGGILDGSLQIGKDDNTASMPLFLKRSGTTAQLANVNDSAGLLFTKGQDIGFLRVYPSKVTFNDYDILTSAGGNLVGDLVFLANSSVRIKPYSATANGGGWADRGLTFINENDTELGGVYAHGNNNQLSYIYIGTQSYNGVNLRIGNGILDWGDNHVIHSGNVGEYAMQYYGTNMPADIVNYVGYGKIETGWKEYGSAITFGISNYYTQIQRRLNTNEYYVRGYDDGTYTDWKTIAFTDSNVASADVIAKTYANENINYAYNESKIRLISGTASNSTDLGFPQRYVSGISVLSSYVGWQMVCYGSTSVPNPYYRAVADSGAWGAWKQLAFLDDNVASATKLQTARTIWGQSFDGTGNVDGALIGVTSINSALHINSSGNVTIGASDLAGSNAKLYVNGDIHLGIARLCSIGAPYSASDLIMYNRISIDRSYDGIKYYSGSWTGGVDNISHEFIVGGENKSALAITNGGNVIIGTTTDNGAKLQVNGDATATLLRFVNNDGTTGSYIGRPSTGNDDILLKIPTANDFYIATNGTERMRITRDGNVLIGTTTDAGYKLYVDGTARISDAVRFAHTLSVEGAVTMASTLSVGGYFYSANNDFRMYYNTNTLFLQAASTALILGEGTCGSIPTYICGKGIYFNNSASSTAMAIDSSGNTAFNGDVRINGNLVVTGDISA